MSERKAKVKPPLEERKFQARLEAIRQGFGRYPASSRHRYPDKILRAVVFLETVEDKEQAEDLRRELFGEGTTADKAYGFFRELLGGKLECALDLYDLLPQARWQEVVLELRRDGKSKSSETYHDAAVALHLLGLCGPYVSSTRTKVALKVVVNVSDGLRGKLFRVIEEAVRSGKRDTFLGRLRMHLAYALRGGKLIDPHWCRLLSDITDTGNGQLDLVRSLRLVKDGELAEDLALRAVAAHPTHGRLAMEVFNLLRRIKRDKEAFVVMLDAEERVPYPERRKVRTHYFTMLRYEHYRSSSSKRPPVEGVMTFAEERTERRYAAIWPGDLESQMAWGDVHAVERKTQEALAAYRRVCLEADDAALRWTAWVAWAECDALSAWRQRCRIEDVRADATNAPVSAEVFLQSQCAAALAAGGIEEALGWARERLKAEKEQESVDVLLPIASAMAWLAGDEAYALGLLASAEGTVKARTIDIVLGLPRGQIAASGVLSALLTQAITRRLKGDLEGRDSWGAAARLAIRLVPSCEPSQTVVGIWQAVTRAYPKESDIAAKELQAKLNEAALFWVDARPENDTDLKAVLYGAAYHAYRGYGHNVHANASSLFLKCLERAAERELSAVQIKSTVSYFTRGLRKEGVPEHTAAACREAIAGLYPDLARAP